LYLCTVADITTTSPAAMTSWKARMLEQLFVAADLHLSGAAPAQVDEQRVVDARAAATQLWQGPKAAFADFVATMPQRYLLANAPDAIARHAGLAIERAPGFANAGIAPTRHPEISELCVVTDDRPGLLASIAAAITANRLEVLAAQVYSRTTSRGQADLRQDVPRDYSRGREAVDLFWVRDRVDAKEGPSRALPRLLRDLGDLTSGRIDDKTLLRTRIGSSSSWRERPTPNVSTEIVVDDRASRRHTVIEVFAKDRPGLLYTLAQTLHEVGVSIVLSKINTEGTRVADVFYVTELDGSKVEPGPRFKAIRDALSFALEPQSE
jgi:[protein-PII] uridylyltransferase